MAETFIFSSPLYTFLFLTFNALVVLSLLFLGYKKGGFSLYGESTVPSWKLSSYSTDLNRVKQKILEQSSRHLKIDINIEPNQLQYFHMNSHLIFAKDENDDSVFFNVPVWFRGQEINNLILPNKNFTLHFSTHHLTTVII